MLSQNWLIIQNWLSISPSSTYAFSSSLASVPLSLVDDAVSVLAAGVRQLLPHRPLEETLATLATGISRHCHTGRYSVMFPIISHVVESSYRVEPEVQQIPDNHTMLNHTTLLFAPNLPGINRNINKFALIITQKSPDNHTMSSQFSTFTAFIYELLLARKYCLWFLRLQRQFASVSII